MICKCVVEATYLENLNGEYIVKCARCKKPKYEKPLRKVILSSFYGDMKLKK